MSEQAPDAYPQSPEAGRPPKVFVEVGLGPGRHSGYVPDFPFEPGDTYITFDPEYAIRNNPYDPLVRRAEAAEQLLEQMMAEKGATYEARITDGKHLELLDQSVDEVLFCNVMGDRRIKLAERQRLLAEAGRVIKPEGRIVIVGTYTPDETTAMLEDIALPGLEVTRHDTRSPEWNVLKEQYSHLVLGRGVVYTLSPSRQE